MGTSIPLRRKLGYSVGHVLNDLTASMWFSYLITFFHEVKQFDDRLAGYLMLIGQVADAILTPLIGIACDKSVQGCCSMGKRKSWHVIGTVAIVLSFPFIFIPCYKCDRVPDWAQFIYYVPIIILFQFGWASLQISHLSLIPEMTQSSTEKVQLNGWRYATTVMSHTTVYLLALLLIDLHKDEEKKAILNPEDADIFRDLAIYIVAIGVIFSGIFYYCVHEKNHQKNPSARVDQSEASNPNQVTNDENKVTRGENQVTDGVNCATGGENKVTDEVNDSTNDVSRNTDNSLHDKNPRSKNKSKEVGIGPSSAKQKIWTIQEYGCMTSSMTGVHGGTSVDNSRNVRNIEVDESSEHDIDDKEKKSRHWRQWLRQSHFYQVALIYMCTRLVVNISEIYMPMYITDSLKMKKESIAVVPMIGYVSGFVTSLFMRSTNELLGRKRTYIIGQSFTLGACVWLFFIDKDTASRIYGVATLLGIGGSTVLVTSLAMTADLIDEYSDSAGFVYGAMSFLEKLANGIAVVLIQRLNPCKSTDHTSEESCTMYFRDVIVTVPGGVTFVSLLVILSLMPAIGGVHDWKSKDSRRSPRKKRQTGRVTSYV